MKPAKTILCHTSYIGPFCLLPLFIERDNSFSQFHAKQGLLIFIFECGIVFSWIVSAHLPIIGRLTNIIRFANILPFLLILIALFITVVGTLQIVKGKKYGFPFVGNYVNDIPVNQ